MKASQYITVLFPGNKLDEGRETNMPNIKLAYRARDGQVTPWVSLMAMLEVSKNIASSWSIVCKLKRNFCRGIIIYAVQMLLL